MMMIGADGGTNATSGVVPELTRKLYDLAAAGQIDEAVRIQYKILKVFDAILYSADFPEACRVAVGLRGFRMGSGRQPLSDQHKAKLAEMEKSFRQFLADEDLLGGFHFNDRKYADDDLTMGSIDPYQLFRIFYEIVAAEHEAGRDLDIAYMVDQSHNLKPKIEAMIQTVVTAQEHFAKALLVDHGALQQAREHDDVVLAENILREAYNTDVRPFLGEYRKQRELAADPLLAFRESGYSERVAKERAANKPAASGGYA